MSKRLNRFAFSIIAGIVSHYMYSVTHSMVFTLPVFVASIIMLYQLMDMYERRAYQMPIDVSQMWIYP